MEEAQSWFNMRCILVQGNYGATSCAGVSKRMLDTSVCYNDHRSSPKELVCVVKTGFFNRIMLQFTLVAGHRIFSRLITFVFWIIHRVHRS